MKSLKASGSILSDSQYQIEILDSIPNGMGKAIRFEEKLQEAGLFPLHPSGLQIFQMNLGKMCNQVCKHCHVDAGPDRKEVMTRQTMQACLDVLKSTPAFQSVDLTGGAPEMNPDFRWLVQEIRTLQRKVMVRCNLTILLANRKFYDLPDFYRQNQVELICSLPFYSKDRTDRQRGEGVFENSLKALRQLNAKGYGVEGTGLIVNLVYNPSGAFLPPDQSALEKEYKELLSVNFGIHFSHLYTITNVPMGRFLDYLIASGNYDQYMERLRDAFNPSAAQNVMCRNTLSVGWDGRIYDCDFNQMLDLPVNCSSRHISQWNLEMLNARNIVTKTHCFACTAGAGSSCSGTIA